MTFHFEEFDFCVDVPGSDWLGGPEGSELLSDSSSFASEIFIKLCIVKKMVLKYLLMKRDFCEDDEK